MDELEILQHRQIRGLSLFLVTVEYRTAHVHSEWELIWVLDAPLHISCGQNRFLAQPGQMVLFAPDEPHELHMAGQRGATFLCMQVSPDVLPVSRHVAVEEKFPHRVLDAAGYAALQQTLRVIMEAYLTQQEHYGLYCLGQSLLILHTLLKQLPTHVLSAEEAALRSRRNARLKRLLRFVDENYMHKIRLTDFARQEGCSMHYLSAFIKANMHCSFQEYVNSVRFHCARKLIDEGGKRMLDVCMESGFSDYRYFSRAFREQCGMTPEEYSRSSRQPAPQGERLHRSVHSLERFYSRSESLALLQKFL